MKTISLPYIVCGIFMLFIRCEDPDPSTLDGGGYINMTIDPDVDAVKVGSNNYITVKVQVVLDGSGDTCTFTTTGGSFDSKSGGRTNSTSVVNIDGIASVSWFPPQTPGIYKISASIKTLNSATEIVVDPVDELLYSDLPTEMAPQETILFTLSVGKEWAGNTLEVKATKGVLEATGPVSDEFETGNKIKPILDQNGEVQVLYTAPPDAGTIQITTSLFGTFSTEIITVQ